jgi:hypothetical protein
MKLPKMDRIFIRGMRTMESHVIIHSMDLLTKTFFFPFVFVFNSDKKDPHAVRCLKQERKEKK